MKQLIRSIKQQLPESEQSDNIKWKLLKYKMRKNTQIQFAITYSKKISQNARRSQCEL